MSKNSLSSSDREQLRQAKLLLENPGLAVRIADMVGKPMDIAVDNLPVSVRDKVLDISEKALSKAFDAALLTMSSSPQSSSSEGWHKIMAMVTGGVSGAFGLPALAVELPLTTTVILRSIADIARSEGEDISSVETKLAALEVFALGGPSADDDQGAVGYFTVRAALSQAINDAARHVATRGLSREGAPALVAFIAAVSRRFGIVVSEKVVAQSLPIIGSVGGAVLNTLFMSHFQDMARGHFIVRRLERKYGKEHIEKLYLTL